MATATFMRGAPTGGGHVLTFLSRHHKCWINQAQFKAGAVLTHTFLDRTWTGKIFIPPELDDEFQAAVARTGGGDPPPLNELRANPTGVFRFFVDVDLHLPPGEEESLTAEAVGACAAREVKRFLCRSYGEHAVPGAHHPDVPADAEGGGRAKRGIHLHFPLVRVGTHEALLMREALIVALARDVSGKVDWAEDLDNRPYVNATGGLRMLDAPKAVPCTECRDVPATARDATPAVGRGARSWTASTRSPPSWTEKATWTRRRWPSCATTPSPGLAPRRCARRAPPSCRIGSASRDAPPTRR